MFKTPPECDRVSGELGSLVQPTFTVLSPLKGVMRASGAKRATIEYVYRRSI